MKKNTIKPITLHYIVLIAFLLSNAIISAQNQVRLDFGDGFDITNPDTIAPIDIENITDSEPFTNSENRICRGLAYTIDGTQLFANMYRRSNIEGVSYTNIVSKTTLDSPFNLPENFIAQRAGIPPLKDTYNGLAFNVQGSKMFVTDTETNRIRQYSLPVPFQPILGMILDIEIPLNIWTPGGTASKPVFSPNGRELFMISASSRIIHFHLNQAFNLMGGYTYVGSFNNPGTNVKSFRFNREGTQLILLSGASILKQYDLTTPFTISSGVELVTSLDLHIYDGTYDGFIFPTEDYIMEDMIFNKNGTGLIVVGNDPFVVVAFEFQLPQKQFFRESASNDGAVDGSFPIELTNTFFRLTGDLIEGFDYTVSNLPEGLTPRITVAPGNKIAHLTLEGNATNHQSSNNIESIGIEIFPVALSVPQSIANNSITTNVPITFDDNSPIAICKDISVFLDESGLANIDVNDIDDGSSALGGIESISISNTTFSCANIGSNLVTLTIEAVNGLTSTCSATVTVIDDLPISANCVAPFNVTLDASGNASITEEDINNGSSDNCDISSITIDTLNFTCADIGSNTVTLTVTNINGETSTCTTVVTVLSNVSLEINCPEPIIVENNIGNCGAMVVYDTPLVDTCQITTSYTRTTTFLASSTLIQGGTTFFDVSVGEEDLYLNGILLNLLGSTDFFSVNIYKKEGTYDGFERNASVWGNPVAIGSGENAGVDNPSRGALSNDIVLAANTSYGFALVLNTDHRFRFSSGSISFNYSELSIVTGSVSTDFFAGTVLKPRTWNGGWVFSKEPNQIQQTEGLPSGSIFPIGTTTNTFVATDADGTTATCSFDVIVNNITLPEISCPADITVNANPNDCTTIINYEMPTVLSCDGGSETLTTTFNSDAENSAGSTIFFDVIVGNEDIYIDALELNIKNSGSFNVAIFTKVGGYDGHETNASAWGSPVALGSGIIAGTDNPSLATLNNVITLTANTTYGMALLIDGDQRYRYKLGAETFSNNNLTITPGAVTLGAFSGFVSEPSTFSGSLKYSTIEVAQTAGLPSGSEFPIGNTTNTFSVTDASGNSSTCSFDVIITDTTAPVITCNETIIATVDTGECNTVVSYQTPTLTEICGDSGSLTTFVGANAAAPNGGAVFFDVTVGDSVLLLDALGLNVLGIVNSPYDVSVYIKVGSYIGNETNAEAWRSPSASGSSTIVGVNTLSTAQLDSQITLQSNTTYGVALVLSEPQRFYLTTGANTYSNSDLTIETGAVSSGLFSGTVTNNRTWNGRLYYTNTQVAMNQTAGLPSGSEFPIGTTTNTFTATDTSGNTSSCSFDVVVQDPNYTCNDCIDIARYTTSGWIGTPSTDNLVIIETDYNTATLGSFEACELIVKAGATLTIAAEDYILVNGDITVQELATLIVEHTGSLVQEDDDAVVTKNGTINVNVTTPALKPLDFVVTGSPMTAETRNGVYSAGFKAMNHTTLNFFPNPLVDDFYAPNVVANFMDDDTMPGNINDWLDYSGSINPGEGYLIFPQASPQDGNSTYNFNFNQGTLNNGVIEYAMDFHIDKNSSPNVLSNPYPSAIDAEKFIIENNQIDEIYFWEHIEPASSSFPGGNVVNYSMEDISVFNLAGGIGTGEGTAAINGGSLPNGIIATSQGFGVKANAAGIATFNNAMRLTTGNTTLRAPQADRNRIWLQLESQQYGLNSETLVAFTPAATTAFDLGYDSEQLGSIVALYSHLPDGTMSLGIQGREAFNEDIQIPMGCASQIDESAVFKITIKKMEGDGLENVHVYLVDTFEDVEINLTQMEGYSFEMPKGNFPNRFILKFKEEGVLGNNETTISNISVTPNPTEGVLFINSAHSIINTVEILDMHGRIIERVKNIEKRTTTLNISTLQSAVYFININTENGTLVKKVIKQ